MNIAKTNRISYIDIAKGIGILLVALAHADISLIFIEQKNRTVKVSWRAQPGFDVSEIAAYFGGGGHKAAAGAEIPGNLETVEAEVLKATQKLISKCT